MKKSLATLTSAVIATSMASMPVYAAEFKPADNVNEMRTESETSGYCGIYGDNVIWKLDTSTGTLTISGIGNMYDYGNSHINVFGFEYTPWTDYDVKEVIIEDGVLSVGAYAFYFCTSLNSAKIADGVKIIGERAFDNCGYLRSVDIPNSVTKIGDYAFEECYYLSSVEIPKSATYIGDWSFADCTSLTSVTIPEGVSDIGYGAFDNCYNLKSVTIKNPDCYVEDIFGNYYDFNGTIYGYKNSTAQRFAMYKGYKFVSLGTDPKPSPKMTGDIDGSGNIDSSDASIVLQEYALLATGQSGKMTETQAMFADVNADEAIDSSDASLILSYYAYTATGGKDPFDVFLKS